MKYLSPILALLASPAFAHPGDHSDAGLVHMLTEPDHVALLAVVIGGAVFGLIKLVRARR